MCSYAAILHQFHVFNPFYHRNGICIPSKSSIVWLFEVCTVILPVLCVKNTLLFQGMCRECGIWVLFKPNILSTEFKKHIKYFLRNKESICIMKDGACTPSCNHHHHHFELVLLLHNVISLYNKRILKIARAYPIFTYLFTQGLHHILWSHMTCVKNGDISCHLLRITKQLVLPSHARFTPIGLHKF